MKGKIEPRTLKGFRDFGPQQARKRQYIIDTLKEVFESYGFEPLETPALEYEEILLGKYGGEGDKLMYRFKDKGGRGVALRYDQTVPLARFIASNQSITFPFKRYQIQSVWRAENPQRGRFREFLQCDVDTVGTANALSDAEILALVYNSYEELGFKTIKILVSDRSLLKNIPTGAVGILDKLKKIGAEKVRQELKRNKLDLNLLDELQKQKPTDSLREIIQQAEKLGIEKKAIIFEPTLARGLDYYTGLIFEIEVEGYAGGSVGGGGRYDDLIGMFAGRQIPAVGFSFGFDRIYEAMEEQKLFPEELSESSTEILVTVFPGYEEQSMKLVSTLRDEGVNTELYLDEAKLDKQLKYADKKGIPYVVVIGPDEVKDKKITLKDMGAKKQETLTQQELIERFSCEGECEDCGDNYIC